MSMITSTEPTIHAAAPHPMGYAQSMHVAYSSFHEPVLLESLLVQDEQRQRQVLVRRSVDHGQTWSVIETFQEDHPVGNRLLRHYPPIVVRPPRPDLPLLRIVNVCQHRHDVPMWDSAHHPLWRSLRPHIQFSSDGGMSWSPLEPLCIDAPVPGDGQWMPGVFADRNGFAVCSSPPVYTNDGAVLLTGYAARLFGNGDILDPDADPARANPDGAVERMAVCLRLDWHAGGDRPRWTAGEWVTLDQRYSCDGVSEPAIEYLPDGRLFMVLRARVYPHTEQAVPSGHYFATSNDDGMTWSSPLPLIYDDGSWAHSPACLAHVLRCPHTGSLLLLTNLADGPCYNCEPRDRLYLARIDATTCSIVRDSLRLIVAQDPAIQPPGAVRLSNFQWFVHRITHRLVLLITPSGPSQPGDVPDLISHAMRYDVDLTARAS